MMGHLFLRIRGSDIRLKILARIILLLKRKKTKAKSQKGTPLITPQYVGRIMSERPLLPPSPIIIYFTTYLAFHWPA